MFIKDIAIGYFCLKDLAGMYMNGLFTALASIAS